MAKKETPKTELVDINLVIENENNPRFIKDDKFKKLVQSIKDFPEMLNLCNQYL